jgi:hypothetical protein
MTARSLKHKFVSAKVDETDATLIRPSNWNDDHDLWDGYRTVAVGTDSITHGDHLTLITYSVNCAVTLPAPAGGSMPLGWKVRLRALVGTTITVTSSATVAGLTSPFTILAHETLELTSNGSAYFPSRTTASSISVSIDLSSYAPLASPVFTGDPRITTTPSVGDNDTSIANTAYVFRDFLRKADNLGSVANVTTTRNNLGLGNAALYNVGGSTGTIPLWENLGTTKSYNIGNTTGTVPVWEYLGTTKSYNIGNTSNTVPLWDYVVGAFLPLAGGTVGSLTVSPGGLAVNTTATCTGFHSFSHMNCSTSSSIGTSLSVGTSMSVGTNASVSGTMSAGAFVGRWDSDNFPGSRFMQWNPGTNQFEVVGTNFGVQFGIACTDLLVTNSKLFVVQHPDPEKPSQVLRHASLEGPQHGVYYNGSGVIAANSEAAEIVLPDYFIHLCSEESAVVNITSILNADGTAEHLGVTKVSNGKFTVRMAGPLTVDQEFFWRVEATRKNIDPLIVEEDTPSHLDLQTRPPTGSESPAFGVE